MKQVGWITGYFNEGPTRKTAKVPVLFDNRTPSLPGVTRFEEKYFVLVCESPVTYEFSHFGEAEVL